MIVYFRILCLAIFFAIPRIILRLEILHNNPHFLNFIYTSYDITWKLFVYSFLFGVVMNFILQKSKGLFYLVFIVLFVFELLMVLYFQYFSIFPFVESFNLLVNAPEIGGHTLSRLNDFWIILLIMLFVVISVFSISKGSSLIGKKIFVWSMVMMLCMHLVDFKRYVYVDYVFDRNTATFKGGLLGLYIHNIYEVLANDYVPPVKFAGSVNGDSMHISNGLNRKNVIVVQVESLDFSYFEQNKNLLDSVLDNAIYYKNFYAMHSAGGSSDAEFSLYTGLLPSKRSPSLGSYLFSDKNDLASTLKSLGYHLSFFHSFRLSFYDRKSAYTKMGFDLLCDEFCLNGQASGWYAKDNVFYKQVFERLKVLKQPFFSHLVTIQSHGPFENYDSTKCSATKIEGAYDCSMREVLSSLSKFIGSVFLDQDLSNNTTIYVYGDHESAIKPMNGRKHRVPFLIFEKGQNGGATLFPTSQIDVPSIILGKIGVTKTIGLGSYPSMNNRIICYNDGVYIGSKTPKNDSICEYAKLYSISRSR